MEGEISFMKYFRIEFGCGCGDNEEYMKFETLEAAEDYAYESAISDYQSYEGLHGVRGMNEIAEEDFGVEDLDEVIDNDRSLYQDIELAYHEEVENSISYSAEELTEEEYLEEIGAIEVE